MKQLLYIICALACGICTLASCSSEADEVCDARGTVVLQLTCGAVPTIATRAGVDNDLSLVITRADGKPMADGRTAWEYAPGTVPAKITLEVGTFNLHVFTANQSTWAAANGGLGEACHDGTTQICVGEDEIVYCTYRVPMTNYAVSLALPEMFEELFTSYSLNVVSGNRRMSLTKGQRAYLAPTAGFSYQFSATNIDGLISRLPAVNQSNVEAGKCYTITYNYGLADGGASARVVVTDAAE